MKLVLTVGLPGSGKSTWLKNLGVNPVSTDALRLQLADDESDQTVHRQVFAAVRYLVDARLRLKRPITYLDATSLTVADRRQWLRFAARHHCETEAIFFDIPLEICKARNAARGRQVPEAAMDAMAAKLVPPSTKEGFSRIEVVRYLPETQPPASAD